MPGNSRAPFTYPFTTNASGNSRTPTTYPFTTNASGRTSILDLYRFPYFYQSFGGGGNPNVQEL